MQELEEFLHVLVDLGRKGVSYTIHSMRIEKGLVLEVCVCVPEH
jgi:hypothetical protein